MALIDWDESLSVNVAEIDGQHQRLIQMINELNDAMKERRSKEVMKEIIGGLVDYAGTHFAIEEKYFEQFQYTKAFQHKREHDSFAQKVSEFKKGFDEGSITLSMEVLNFLTDWLVNHIKGSDKNYTKVFNENGLT